MQQRFSEKWLPGALGPELWEALVIERAHLNGLTAKEQLTYDTSKETLKFQGQETSVEGSLNQRKVLFDNEKVHFRSAQDATRL